MKIQLGAALAALTLMVGVAVAQTPAQDTGSAPALGLSVAQKQTIYQSVSNTRKNNAAPEGFRVSVGARVPDGIELSPVPDTLASLMPQTRGYEVAMIERQVVLVDPKTKQIVVVAQGKP